MSAPEIIGVVDVNASGAAPDQYDAGVDAIALRFVMDSLQPTLVLSGAATKEQLAANLKARSIELSPEEIASLKKYSTSAEAYWKERKQLLWN